MKKTIFVDFDDTLCLHKYNLYIDARIFEKVDVACDKFYNQSELNKELYKYLIDMKKNGYEIILLSSACSKMLDVKKYWIEKYCPLVKFDDYIAVSIDIDKTKVMCEYAKYHKIDTSDLIFIDDNCTERKCASEAGIITYSPQLIMNK